MEYIKEWYLQNFLSWPRLRASFQVVKNQFWLIRFLSTQVLTLNFGWPSVASLNMLDWSIFIVEDEGLIGLTESKM
jgi:hypothetical protein